MAVKIRLKRMGKIRTPFYRVVVADSRTKRDGRVIEEIGTYNPKADPSIIQIDSDRAQHWLKVGAQPTEAVVALLRLTGDWEKHTGEKQTKTLIQPEPKRSKAEIFDEALKVKDSEPRKAPAKAEVVEEVKAAEEAPTEAAPADEAPAEAASETEAPAEEATASEAAPTDGAPAAETETQGEETTS